MYVTEYYKDGQIAEDELGRHAACVGKKNSIIGLAMGKPEGKRSLEKP